MQQLQSKTVMGFLTLVACVMILALMGKLTQEAVDAIKWLGGTFMTVRTAANIMENLPGAVRPVVKQDASNEV